MKTRILCPFLSLLLGATWLPAAGVEAYHLVWDRPSEDHHGSMPLGNGDLSANAWIEPSGALVFYIGKTDSWGDNARLLKVGKVRVTLDPAPLVTPFRQELSLADGTLKVRYGDGTSLHLWVDANHPVIHVDVAGTRPVTATAAVELWRTARTTLPSIECSDVMTDRSQPGNMHGPTVVEPDTLLTGLTNRIGWYHHNIKSVGPAQHAQIQGTTGYQRVDPLLHRTFGAVITADRAQRLDDTRLESPASAGHHFAVHVLTQHPATPESWRSAMDALITSTAKSPLDLRRQAHAQWWREFWERSWIHITASEPAPAPVIPPNALPVLTGRDQAGQNLFPGEISHARLGQGVRSGDEIAARAANRPAAPAAALPADGKALPADLTVEAWIKPGNPAAAGRIIDNITPGGSDGFLLDILPGNQLRFIAGTLVVTKSGVLIPDQWQHVAVTVDAAKGQIRLYHNGRQVAESEVATGDDTFVLSQAYALQRFVTACAGRGAFPIKFNGSIFTVPAAGTPGDADYRRWGPGYWWQNTRLPYISLCTSGDFEMLEPLFRMYVDELLPFNQHRTKRYFGFEGAYYAECIHFWGDVFNESYGWTPVDERKDPLQQSGYHKWEWVAGPELVWMMLDAYEHTLDEKLLRERILPTAGAVIRFFDNYYRTDAGGRLVMHPSQALETWWNCTNPMPELAGLRAITNRLLALPETATTAEDRAGWKSFAAKLAPLPVRNVPGGKALAPATEFADKRNIENPELYAVFPFRLCSFEKDNRDLGLLALQHRWDRGNSGWRQDGIFMAYLGLADEARRSVVDRARHHDKGSRFPAFWGPNFDWVPDQDHGGVLMKTVQAMLIQTEGRDIFLLPAWPRDWDVSFRVHAPDKTVLEGTLRDGKLVGLRVEPAGRRDDVQLPDWAK